MGFNSARSEGTDGVRSTVGGGIKESQRPETPDDIAFILGDRDAFRAARGGAIWGIAKGSWAAIEALGRLESKRLKRRGLVLALCSVVLPFIPAEHLKMAIPVLTMMLGCTISSVMSLKFYVHLGVPSRMALRTLESLYDREKYGKDTECG